MKNKRGRFLDGILLLDKSVGASSNAALQRIKYLFDAKKAGHAGTLDPLATGMLPIFFGRATGFAGYVLASDKCYRTTATLGVTTTTADAEGEVLKTLPVPAIDAELLEKILQPFYGTISQIPPMYSALKHQGQPLYALARKGITVEREPRSVTIHDLDVLSCEGDKLELRIRCTKGTYVRTLIEDIGRALGCGAHVSSLKREYVSPYQTCSMHTYDALNMLKTEQGVSALDRLLLPIESSLDHFPVFQVTSADKFYLKLGKPITIIDKNNITSGFVRLCMGAQFMGVGEIENGQLMPRRIVE